MKANLSFFRKTFFGASILCSAFALSACGQPTTDNTTTPLAGETANPNVSPVAETPTETPTVTVSPTTPSTTDAAGTQNLGELAQAASSQGSFTILTKAVQAAGLEQNLTG